MNLHRYSCRDGLAISMGACRAARSRALAVGRALVLVAGVASIQASVAFAQVHWQVVGAEGRIQGSAFANADPAPGFALETCDLVGPGNTPLPFQAGVSGGSDNTIHEFGQKCFREANNNVILPPRVFAQAVIMARAFIDGDNTDEVTIEWLNQAYCDQSADIDAAADADMSLDFTIDLQIVDPAAPPGTPVLVYFYWDAFGGANTHHDCPDYAPNQPADCLPVNDNDDPVLTTNTLFVGLPEVLGGRFDFASPGGVAGWNVLTGQGGVIWSSVGSTIPISLDSTCEAALNVAPPIGILAGAPEVNAIFKGKLRITVGHVPQPPVPPPQPQIEFSLDIGSDTELSDQNVSGNEVFDPGDTYVWGGPGVAFCTNGVRDDADIFAGVDVPPNCSGAPPAPVCSGPWSPGGWFDLDGTDSLDFSLSQILPPVTIGPVSFFPSDCIYSAEDLVISYDDDGPGHYADLNCLVPVNSTAPLTGQTFGKSTDRDEATYVFSPVTISSGAIASTPAFALPIADEQTVHINMFPNPDGLQADDDDVDALDAIHDAAVCTFWYVSADHEATSFDPVNGILLNPGNIYEATPAGPVSVIDHALHLGLPNGVDIDAFEFVWLFNPDPVFNGVFLVLLFSVDVDDPLTLSDDESGGLDPRMLYASFLDGTHFAYLATPFGENVDALTTWQAALLPPATMGACCDGNGCQMMDQISCVTLGGTYRGDGTDCADANLNGEADTCECLTCRGDVNGDSVVDGKDIQWFLNCFLNGPFVNCACADMDANGLHELPDDVGIFVAALLQGGLFGPGQCP